MDKIMASVGELECTGMELAKHQAICEVNELSSLLWADKRQQKVCSQAASEDLADIDQVDEWACIYYDTI